VSHFKGVNGQMDKIIGLKKEMLRMAYRAQEGHIGSSFSCIDIIWYLYKDILNSNDMFVLSKGHASLAYYVVLAELDYIDKSELDNFCKFNSKLGGHINRDINGISVSTGSLGHGLPISVGMAMSKKIKDESGRIFCLVGDGELQEGSSMEALLMAQYLHLDNLVIIVDWNYPSYYNAWSYICHEFKCMYFDGHSQMDICKHLNMSNDNNPMILIAKTVKGKGCKSMEYNPE
jgi:transketolase